ncbi:MAG: NTP transferase domain-containing protein [Peptococcaceae bacterium]|nr:NTP transferase domain-containing protein [Peptococcaceae bacterium]
MIDCILLAGSPNDGPLAAVSDEAYEALIPIGDSPIIDYVLRALLDCREINHVLVVGPSDLNAVIPLGGRVELLPPAGGLMENLEQGLKALGDEQHVLVATSDIPLITGPIVERFLAQCGDRSAEVYYPVVTEDTVAARYTGAKRTYVRLREGRFTGGNMALLHSSAYERCRRLAALFAENRKKPLKLARIVGIGLLLRFVTGTLSLQAVESKVTALAGITGRALVCQDPEIAVDVDKPEDYELVLRELGKLH